MNDTDARLSHPRLRINRVLRAMLTERWSAEAWPQVKAEFTKALALKSHCKKGTGTPISGPFVELERHRRTIRSCCRDSRSTAH